MKVIAFVSGRPKPQPRTTNRSTFLFSKPVEHWMLVDAQNKYKSEQGLLNKKGKAFRETRYADRLRRLQKTNEYRAHVRNVVTSACNGEIPHNNLFFFYLFKMPRVWSKKKKASLQWTFHEMKPDYSNLLKGIEDCLYVEDSKCNGVAHYKLYVPVGVKEGLLIMHDEEIHKYIIEMAVEAFNRLLLDAPATYRTEVK